MTNVKTNQKKVAVDILLDTLVNGKSSNVVSAIQSFRLYWLKNKAVGSYMVGEKSGLDIIIISLEKNQHHLLATRKLTELAQVVAAVLYESGDYPAAEYKKTIITTFDRYPNDRHVATFCLLFLFRCFLSESFYSSHPPQYTWDVMDCARRGLVFHGGHFRVVLASVNIFRVLLEEEKPEVNNARKNLLSVLLRTNKLWKDEDYDKSDLLNLGERFRVLNELGSACRDMSRGYLADTYRSDIDAYLRFEKIGFF